MVVVSQQVIKGRHKSLWRFLAPGRADFKLSHSNTTYVMFILSFT
jgi:hypothetical protein